MTTRIALIHAVKVAIAPVEEAFGELWPEAECGNILDNSLSLDRERDGDAHRGDDERIMALAEYAAGTGAAGILFTCSAFGEAIEAAAARAPVPGAEAQRGDVRGGIGSRPADRHAGDLRTERPVDGGRVPLAGRFPPIAGNDRELLRRRSDGRAQGGRRGEA